AAECLRSTERQGAVQVVLVNSDLIDKLRVVVHSSIPGRGTEWDAAGGSMRGVTLPRDLRTRGGKSNVCLDPLLLFTRRPALDKDVLSGSCVPCSLKLIAVLDG